MDRLIDAMSKADWSVLLTIVLGFIVLVYLQIVRSKNLDNKIDLLEDKLSNKYDSLYSNLENEISIHHKNLGEDVSERQVGLGSLTQGSYKNLGEKISSEHMAIKKDTESVHDMMFTEKRNREILYNSNAHGKEILEKLDFLRETVDRNAQLIQEVSELKVENQRLSSFDKNLAVAEEISHTIRSFEKNLSELQYSKKVGEIEEYLEVIKNTLANYFN